jgi:hypothetical protein
MSDLAWLERIETRRREWGGGFFLADAEVDFVLAAARAHLEGNDVVRLLQCVDDKIFTEHDELLVETAIKRAKAQPTQQREDERGERSAENPSGAHEMAPGRKPSPAPSSTVELCDCGEPLPHGRCYPKPSHDAGLVERLRNQIDYDQQERSVALFDEAAAALEAKDFEFACVCSERDQAQAEIERLREALLSIRDSYWPDGESAAECIDRLQDIALDALKS